MDYQASKLLKLESGMSYEKQDITTPSTDVGAGYYDFWVWPYYNEKGQFYDTLEIVMSSADWLVVAK